MKRPSRRFAALAALALLVQSTGAASLPMAVLHAPGAFPPPATRVAFFPPRAAASVAPAGSNRGALRDWLESVRVVAAYLLAEATAPSPETAPSTPAPSGDDVNKTGRYEEVALIAAPPPPAPDASPATDRMLVVMAKGESVEGVIAPGDRDFSTPPAPAAGLPSATVPDFREAWIEQEGLRARVTYRSPHGIVTGDAAGYRAVFADGTVRFAPARGLTAPFRRSFPIFFHNEAVTVELEIVNRTGGALRHVRVEAVQETFRPVGTEGRRTAPPVEVEAAVELAPGARATVVWSAPLRDATRGSVNLEQTHVRVTADGAAPSSRTELMDAPQAGVVDPPGPALMP
ncbi:MAG: hypothetical protein KGJ84_13290 [Elusimicrobia bacterium]|nr:hypothetical protein [Elusimicrobiota bacterium]